MNQTLYLRSRLRQKAQTVFYVAVVAALLMLSGWLAMGQLGVLLLLGLSVVAVVSSSYLPVAVLMRMRRAWLVSEHEAEGLHAVVRGLSRRAGLRSMPALYLQPSAELQAFAVVSGGQTAIAVTPPLLQTLTGDELQGVLAHEISHIQSGDTRTLALVQAMRRLTRALATVAWLSLALGVLLPTLFQISGLAIAAMVSAPVLSHLAELGLSRAREYDADLAAARLTQRPEALASALAKLERVRDGLLRSVLGFDPAAHVPDVLKTHPPTRERVARLLELRPGAMPTLRARLQGPPTFARGARVQHFQHYSSPVRNMRWSVTTI